MWNSKWGNRREKKSETGLGVFSGVEWWKRGSMGLVELIAKGNTPHEIQNL